MEDQAHQYHFYVLDVPLHTNTAQAAICHELCSPQLKPTALRLWSRGGEVTLACRSGLLMCPESAGNSAPVRSVVLILPHLLPCSRGAGKLLNKRKSTTRISHTTPARSASCLQQDTHGICKQKCGDTLIWKNFIFYFIFFIFFKELLP